MIKLNSLLPTITGPALVQGMQKGLPTAGPSIAIDGSNFINGDNQSSCPGTVTGVGPNSRSVFGPGLAVVDSGNVTTNLEIRQFCIGILSLRSHDNRFDHNTIHNTSGAAAILITGDAGDAAGSSTSGLSVNNLIDSNLIYQTGDGFECTRGTANTTYRNNVMYELRDRPDVPYSQGIECAGTADRIYIIDNTFTGYSDGLQLNAATNTVVAGNTINASTFGITWSGSGVAIGNTITGGRMGIGPSGAASAITLSQNSIYNNGHAEIISAAGSAGGTTNPASPALLGIDFGSNGPTANDGTADTNPQNFPVLSNTSVWNPNGTVILNGTITSSPNAILKLEFFANHGLNPSGFAEGEMFLGRVTVTTDAAGAATFTFTSSPNPLGDGSTSVYFTATATNTAGSTSEFSAPVQLSR